MCIYISFINTFILIDFQCYEYFFYLIYNSYFLHIFVCFLCYNIHSYYIVYILYTYIRMIRMLLTRFSRQRDLNVSNFTVGLDDSLFERVHKFPSMMSALIGRRHLPRKSNGTRATRDERRDQACPKLSPCWRKTFATCRSHDIN